MKNQKLDKKKATKAGYIHWTSFVITHLGYFFYLTKKNKMLKLEPAFYSSN